LDTVPLRAANMTPAEILSDPVKVARRIRQHANLVPTSINCEFDLSDIAQAEEEFRAVCKLARLVAVATLTIPAAPTGTDFESEARRLQHWVQIAAQEGLVLTVETRIGTLTEWPDVAVRLCERVPSLFLTLDPSHYICGPNQNRPYDHVFPWVRHVHLRDSGRTPDKMQVRVGQGEIEYSRVVSQLERCHYDRGLSVEIHDAPNLPFIMDAEVRKLKYLLESLA
ncbi:MAG TPA: sugar phosphate isomerase/epimerase, partial [Gemmatales bacterium]|nr:sugar phosphate isomerase/epimerase [Gemmatales bacterium]